MTVPIKELLHAALPWLKYPFVCDVTFGNYSNENRLLLGYGGNGRGACYELDAVSLSD